MLVAHAKNTLGQLEDFRKASLLRSCGGAYLALEFHIAHNHGWQLLGGTRTHIFHPRAVDHVVKMVCAEIATKPHYIPGPFNYAEGRRWSQTKMSMVMAARGCGWRSIFDS